MLYNYLKIAIRTLWKYKTHSFINIVGLAVAFGSSTLLFLAAYSELSFDRFHAGADRIYRSYFVVNRAGGVQKVGSMPYPFMPTLKAELPEVEKATRFISSSGTIVYGGKQYSKDIRCADPAVLTMFSFPMRQGSAATALNSLNGIVLSENTAKDIFGRQNPMGRALLVKGFGEQKEYIVTGVVSDNPVNSSIDYDAFIRIENGPDYARNKSVWENSNHEVYLSLRSDTDRPALEKRLDAFTRKYFQNVIRELKQSGAQPNEEGGFIKLRLQPLTDVHFDTELIQGMGISRTYVYTLLAIGAFILLIAAINYINLTLARSFARTREVGVRKSLGAQRGQLVVQLWGESLLTGMVGLLLGLALAVWATPRFNALFRANLFMDFLADPLTLLVILTGFLGITVVAGGYPALLMARFPTVRILKGLSAWSNLRNGKPGALRDGLIVSQFAIACALIAGTFVVLRQIDYLRSKSLGFSGDQVISIPVGDEVNGADALRQLRNRLADNPNVIALSGTGVNLGNGLDGNSSRNMAGFMHKGREVVADWLRVDYDYLKVLGIDLLAGRDFSRAYPTDSSSAVIITSSMARRLGEKNPVGTIFKAGRDDKPYQVVGVVPDFHLYALHTTAGPIALQMEQRYPVQYLLVRVTPQSLAPMMATLKEVWRQIAPKSEFLASFLNENTDRWYRREERLSTIFAIGAGIAVLLSCMGLFAIALLTIEQRTKEVGIRKVLGASVAGIAALLSKEFLKLVFIGILIATPTTWYLMKQWLREFAYQVEPEWWVFALAGALAAVIALLTVSFQTIRAARANPVRSLRSE